MNIERIADSDFNSLLDLKQQTMLDKSNQLSEMSQQFEAVLLQSTLKSACIDQHFNSLAGEHQEVFQSTPEGQYVDKMLITPDVRKAAILAVQQDQIVLDTPKTTAFMFHGLPDTAHQLSNPVEKNKLGMNPSVDEFVKSIWPFAKQASNMIGLDPKVLLAQAALETGWGQFIAKDSDGNSSNNLFNIKASTKQSEESVQVKTTEFIADTPVKMVASFKKYQSVEHSVKDYITLIKNNQRYTGALSNVDDPKRYIDALQGAGYATDPNYANKILSIYHGDELQQALERNGYA